MLITTGLFPEKEISTVKIKVIGYFGQNQERVLPLISCNCTFFAILGRRFQIVCVAYLGPGVDAVGGLFPDWELNSVPFAAAESMQEGVVGAAKRVA